MAVHFGKGERRAEKGPDEKQTASRVKPRVNPVGDHRLTLSEATIAAHRLPTVAGGRWDQLLALIATY